jgi:hypothetical protein
LDDPGTKADSRTHLAGDEHAAIEVWLSARPPIAKQKPPWTLEVQLLALVIARETLRDLSAKIAPPCEAAWQSVNRL